MWIYKITSDDYLSLDIIMNTNFDSECIKLYNGYNSVTIKSDKSIYKKLVKLRDDFDLKRVLIVSSYE